MEMYISNMPSSFFLTAVVALNQERLRKISFPLNNKVELPVRVRSVD